MGAQGGGLGDSTEGGLHFTPDRIVFADFDSVVLGGRRIPVLVVAYETLGLQVWRTDAPDGITLLYYYPGLAVRLARVLQFVSPAGADAVLAYVPAASASEVLFFSLTRGARYRCSAGGRRRGAPPFLDLRSSGYALAMATVHGLHVMDTAPIASLERVDQLACVFVPTACPAPDRPGAFALGPRWLAYAAPDRARTAPARPGFVAPRADSVWAVSGMAATAVVRGLATGASLVSDAAVRWFGDNQQANGPVASGVGFSGAGGGSSASASGSSSSAGNNSNTSSARTSSSTLSGAGSGNVPGDGSVGIYDVRTRQTVALFRAHENPVAALAWDRSGLVLVSSDVRGHEFAVFTVGGAHVQCVYTLHRGITDGDIRSLAVSADTEFVAAATSRGTVHMYPLAKDRAHTKYQSLNAVGRFRHTLASFASSSSTSSSSSSLASQQQRGGAPPTSGGLFAYLTSSPSEPAGAAGAAGATGAGTTRPGSSHGNAFTIVTSFGDAVRPARLLVQTNAGALYVYAVCPDGNGVLERVCDIAPLPREREFWVTLPAPAPPAPADPKQFLPAHVDLATGPPAPQPLWRDRRFAFAHFDGSEGAHPTETTPVTPVEVARAQPPGPVAVSLPPSHQQQRGVVVQAPRQNPPQSAPRASRPADAAPAVPAPAAAAPVPAPVEQPHPQPAPAPAHAPVEQPNHQPAPAPADQFGDDSDDDDDDSSEGQESGDSDLDSVFQPFHAAS